jgi:hypothetical protein
MCGILVKTGVYVRIQLWNAAGMSRSNYKVMKRLYAVYGHRLHRYANVTMGFAS